VACKLVRQRNIRAIWSTFPIATAHSIGLEVARQTGLPWLAEFRDPMWQGDYPPDPQVNRAWQAMEHEIFLKASRVVVTTPSAARLYAERFAEHKAKVAVIENGYDEETFARAEADFSVPNTRHGPFVLLHSGVIYPSERDPTQFFAALAALKRRGVLSAQDLRVVLRATGNDQQFRTQLEALDIVDIVRLEPSVSYLDALREMLSVDALLIMQAANCNAQIPAKLYEYLRAGRPILALTDPAGDTAGALQAAGAGTLARLDSQEEIERTLPEFLRRVRDDSWERAGTDAVQRYSRRSQTGQLARLLDAAIG
jgi:glycosyltransferase involved in cell wall biosynthesis